MASGMLRRVRARKAEDEDLADLEPSLASEQSEQENSESDEAPGESGEDTTGSDAKAEGDSDSSTDQPNNAFADISFGALASAQESVGNKRKRLVSDITLSRRRVRSPSPFHEAEERRAGKNTSNPENRTSKHAPTELSSKKAVSRKRSAVPVPSVIARDPRFSSLAGTSLEAEKLQRNYNFLDEYRASEIAQLKVQLRDTRDPVVKEALKQQIRPMEDRERARKRTEEEKEVVRAHKRSEREAVKQGKTPYFLKKGEVKKQVLVKRFEGMGEKRVEKVMERRRKKKAGMAKRALPTGRRDGENAG